MTDTSMPSFLAKRVTAAKAAAEAARAKQAKQPQARDEATRNPHAAVPNPASPAPATPRTAAKTAGQAKKGAKSVKQGESDRGNPILDPATQERHAAAVALFRRHSTNEEAFDLATHDLGDVWDTIIRGSKIAGPGGQSDRMTLFRMLGVPWTPAAPLSRGSDPDAAATNRLASALTRIEQRMAGHVPVTVEIDMVPDTSVIGLLPA